MHAPSEARALVQEARRGGRPLTALIPLARALPDVGHAAETLATIAAEPDCPADHGAEARRQACNLAERVPRMWRRAEVMGTIAEMTARADPDDRDAIERRLVEMTGGFDPGDARREAITNIAPHLAPSALAPLFEVALANGPAPWDEVRLVLRAWLDQTDETARRNITERIAAVPDAALRARMLAYIDRRTDDADADPLDAALDALAEIPETDAAIEAWRAVVQKADDAATLARIHKRLTEADPVVRLTILPALVGRAYREDDDPSVIAWHDETLATLPRAVDPVVRMRALVNLAKAHARAGHQERLDAALARGRELVATMTDPGRSAWSRKLEQAAKTQAVKPKPEPRAAATPTATASPTATATATTTAPAARKDAALTHHALALHDTYTGGLGPAHLRAVARAAPLCDAFDLDLVLFDFPVDDLATLVAKVEAETNIGEGSGSLRRLVETGRVRVVPLAGGGPPDTWAAMGIPVATTPHPTRERRTDLPHASEAGARFDVPGGRVCLVMGLGKQGLPKRWLDAIPFHYEITGRDVSLETATAMGILAERLRALGPPRAASQRGRGPQRS